MQMVTISSSSTKTDRRNLLGLLPLGFFTAHLLFRYSQGRAAEVLWLCHLSTLMLAVGMLLSRAILIRIAVNTLIPGLLLWIVDIINTGEIGITTVISHLGGLAVGLFALSRCRAREDSWIYALFWGLFMQLVCRIFTAPVFNINVAHAVYPGWERFFSYYWQYWLANTCFAGGYLWLSGLLMLKLFPPEKEKEF